MFEAVRIRRREPGPTRARLTFSGVGSGCSVTDSPEALACLGDSAIRQTRTTKSSTMKGPKGLASKRVTRRCRSCPVA